MFRYRDLYFRHLIRVSVRGYLRLTGPGMGVHGAVARDGVAVKNTCVRNVGARYLLIIDSSVFLIDEAGFASMSSCWVIFRWLK